MRARGLLLIAGASLALAAAAGAVLWAGEYLTRPARSAAPADIAWPELQPLRFRSASGVDLSAWFVRGRDGAGAILLLHGVRENKQTMLARARFLHRLGFSLLLPDLQAHGESTGERITFGYREAADVAASVRKLQELAPRERLGALGRSLGAAAIVFSEAQPLLAASVLESLYPSIDAAVANRLRIRFGALGPWLAPLLLVQIEPRLGVRPEQLRPIDRLARFRHPVLLVHGTEDRHTPLDEAERMLAALPAEKESFFVAGAAHLDLHRAAGEAYEQRIGSFFARHLRESVK
jgi:fermentation-respiration switch protein FrsA (DUF1100 family)